MKKLSIILLLLAGGYNVKGQSEEFRITGVPFDTCKMRTVSHVDTLKNASFLYADSLGRVWLEKNVTIVYCYETDHNCNYTNFSIPKNRRWFLRGSEITLISRYG